MPSADVCVFGATAGGVVAAVAAAGEGASVVLLNPRTHVGGMLSGGLSRTDIERQGQPSKWVTLRACAVLKAAWG